MPISGSDSGSSSISWSLKVKSLQLEFLRDIELRDLIEMHLVYQKVFFFFFISQKMKFHFSYYTTSTVSHDFHGEYSVLPREIRLYQMTVQNDQRIASAAAFILDGHVA